MQSIFILVVVAICVLAILNFALQLGGTGETKVRRKNLMTQSELEFWWQLRAAAAPLHVGPQVAMSALLMTVGGATSSARRSTRNRFDRQCVDFILFDDFGDVRLIVEHDDSTHNAARDRTRDERTAEAGYPTLRVRRRDVRTVAQLAARIAEKGVDTGRAESVAA